jgi:hypothetical protein
MESVEGAVLSASVEINDSSAGTTKKAKTVGPKRKRDAGQASDRALASDEGVDTSGTDVRFCVCGRKSYSLSTSSDTWEKSHFPECRAALDKLVRAKGLESASVRRAIIAGGHVFSAEAQGILDSDPSYLALKAECGGADGAPARTMQATLKQMWAAQSPYDPDDERQKKYEVDQTLFVIETASPFSIVDAPAYK